METTAPTIVVTEVIDYTYRLQEIERYAAMSADASALIACIAVFFLVVVLCYFVYKFFRIFF